MDVIRKDATITNTDDAFPGTFEVILSAPTKDRDGETLLPGEWKQPLPEHITFDSDHGMTVASTVGSGAPRLDEKGNLVVSGTYSSLPRAQEVRTLVKEGHINRTSVAFMSERTQKGGTTVVTRELLNGAFVAIPSNREAVVLSAKGLKAGSRNSKSDAAHIQAIHDHALALGATPATGGDGDGDEDVAAAKSAAVAVLKSIATTELPAELRQALDLIVAHMGDGESEDASPEPDDDDDSAASETPAAAAASAAAAADAKAAAVEDVSAEQQAAVARMRLYATLSERQ